MISQRTRQRILTMHANGITADETAKILNIPIQTVADTIRYQRTHQANQQPQFIQPPLI